MKIFLMLIFLIPSLAHAADCVNKIAKSEFIKRVAQVPNAGLLTCKDLPTEPCFCLDGKSDYRKWKLGFRTIDITKTQDCNNATDCQDTVDEQGFSCPNEKLTFDDKTNWPNLEFDAEDPPRPATGFFLWCEKQILVVDVAGTASADAADAQLATDNATRATKKVDRDIALADCVRDSKGTMTPGQQTACIAALVRHILGLKVAPSDL